MELEDEIDECRRLLVQMDLICCVCNQAMGDRSEKLEALPCFHLVHARSVVSYFINLKEFVFLECVHSVLERLKGCYE